MGGESPPDQQVRERQVGSTKTVILRNETKSVTLVFFFDNNRVTDSNVLVSTALTVEFKK